MAINSKNHKGPKINIIHGTPKSEQHGEMLPRMSPGVGHDPWRHKMTTCVNKLPHLLCEFISVSLDHIEAIQMYLEVCLERHMLLQQTLQQYHTCFLFLDFYRYYTGFFLQCRDHNGNKQVYCFIVLSLPVLIFMLILTVILH